MAENITGFQTADGVALVDYDYLANKPVTRIVSESADTAPVLRSLESGSYILQGKFRAYTGATGVLGFSSALMVNVIKSTAKSSVQIFYPVNNCVQFLEITDEAMTKTFVYLNQVLEHIGTMKNLTTEDKTSLVAAINELVDMVSSMSGGTGGGITEETDPTVPAWAKEPNKPTYTAEDVGAAEKDHNHDEKYQPKGNYAAEGHDHDGKYQPVGNYLTEESDPTVPSWAKQPAKPTYTADEVKARPDTWMPTAEDVGARPSTWTPTASDVGADKSGTAASKVTEHNAATDAHNDIRLLIQGLDARLTALADSDDTTLDQLSELVAYIKANRGLIESITTDKVNVSDIINNLTTNDAKKPLSAAQGVALKALIDALTTTVNGKVTDAQVATAISNALKAYPTTTAMQTAISTALADYAKADHNHDGTYAKPADIPTTLPNPKALTINGKTYDGSAAVEVTVSVDDSSDKLMFISPDGSDSNDGLTVDTPKATVKACFVAGASKISAKRGVYRQAVDISPTGGVGNVAGRTIEIYPTDNDQTYSTDTHDRGRIVFDTSDELAVSAFGAYNSIKSAPYSVSNYTFTRVFVNGATDGRATVWLVSADERTVCRMLSPATTLAEVEATANTFYWGDGTLYVNADWTGVEKVFVSNEMYNQLQFKGLASVILREVEARLPQGYAVNIENVPHFELYECVAKFTGVKSTGLHPKNASGKMVKCYATRCYDGLSPSGYGHTVYVDCVAEYNRDDGLSHHNACTGTIIGGRYSFNGKYGIDPAYGAKVDIYNVFCEGNGFDYNGGGIGYLYAADLIPASGIVQGAVLVGNKVGLSVGNSCSVVASNCVFADNDTDKSIHASANYTEYNITDGFVKSVNGAKPDSNGNVTIEVSGGESVVDTNLLHSAINSDGSKYGDANGDNTDGYGNGYRVGYRISSSGVEKESSVNCCTGFIACQPNEVFTMENFTNETTGYSVIYFFDSSFAKATGQVSVESCIADGVATITIPSTPNIAYMRITTGVITDETVITKASA